jgi:hypothetical protein
LYAYKNVPATESGEVGMSLPEQYQNVEVNIKEIGKMCKGHYVCPQGVALAAMRFVKAS